MARASAVLSVFLTCGLVAAPALAQERVTGKDVVVLYMAPPEGYTPERTDMDEEDDGKTFKVSCLISASGRLHDCHADAAHMYDQNLVLSIKENLAKWLIGPKLRNGESSAGRLVTLTFTTRF